MNSPAFATIRMRLTFSTKYSNRHQGTITSNATVVNHLFRRYRNVTVVAKADEEVCRFKKGSLTPWVFPKVMRLDSDV